MKVKVKGYSSGFLPDSYNRNVGISCSLETKTRILILAQSFDSGSAQPLAKAGQRRVLVLLKHHHARLSQYKLPSWPGQARMQLKHCVP